MIISEDRIVFDTYNVEQQIYFTMEKLDDDKQFWQDFVNYMENMSIIKNITLNYNDGFSSFKKSLQLPQNNYDVLVSYISFENPKYNKISFDSIEIVISVITKEKYL